MTIFRCETVWSKKMFPPKILYSVICLSLGLNGAPLAAQGQCNIAELQATQPITLAQALTIYKTVSLVKDEFETTAAYNERVATVRQGLPDGPLLVSIRESGLTKFNADTGLVTVSSYAISSNCLVSSYGLSAELKALRFGSPSRYGDGSAYCITKIVNLKEAGNYEATNGFGAKATVTKSNVDMEGVFFGMGEVGQPLLAGRDRFSSDPLFSFAASAEEARSLKNNAEVVLLLQPLAPFSGKGSYLSTPTFKSPRETFYQIDFIVARPLCVGIRDGATGKIFAASVANGAGLTSAKILK